MSKVDNIIGELDPTKHKCHWCYRYFLLENIVFETAWDLNRKVCIKCHKILNTFDQKKYMTNKVNKIIGELDPNQFQCKDCEKYFKRNEIYRCVNNQFQCAFCHRLSHKNRWW